MTSHFVSSSSNKSSVAMEDILFSFSSLPFDNVDSIRDEIKKTLEIQVELENALIEENASENLNCDREVESECALDRIIEKHIAESESVLDVNLQKNIEEKQKLSKALEDLKKFSTKPLNKNSKQGKQPVRRNS
jgi:cell division protein FtsX